jgi:histidine triad (HIT) family protein
MVSEEELKNMSPEEIKKLQEENCIFCKIGKKEIPAHILYEDDLCYVTLDIQPLTFGHSILLPKKHYVFFSQIPDDETKHLFKVAKQLSQSMLKALQVKGTNIFIANGEAAGQAAPHCIIHIVPRKEEELIESFLPGKEKISEENLTKMQLALINRIDEKFGTDMKQKLLTTPNKEKTEYENKEEQKHMESKTTTKHEDNNQQKEQNKSNQKETEQNKDVEEEPIKKKEKMEHVDLDKIADMFK